MKRLLTYSLFEAFEKSRNIGPEWDDVIEVFEDAMKEYHAQYLIPEPVGHEDIQASLFTDHGYVNNEGHPDGVYWTKYPAIGSVGLNFAVLGIDTSWDATAAGDETVEVCDYLRKNISERFISMGFKSEVFPDDVGDGYYLIHVSCWLKNDTSK